MYFTEPGVCCQGYISSTVNLQGSPVSVPQGWGWGCKHTRCRGSNPQACTATEPSPQCYSLSFLQETLRQNLGVFSTRPPLLLNLIINSRVSLWELEDMVCNHLSNEAGEGRSQHPTGPCSATASLWQANSIRARKEMSGSTETQCGGQN